MRTVAVAETNLSEHDPTSRPPELNKNPSLRIREEAHEKNEKGTKKNEKDANEVVLVDSVSETQEDSASSGAGLKKVLPDNQLGETQPSVDESDGYTEPKWKGIMDRENEAHAEWKRALMRPSTAELDVEVILEKDGPREEKKDLKNEDLKEDNDKQDQGPKKDEQREEKPADGKDLKTEEPPKTADGKDDLRAEEPKDEEKESKLKLEEEEKERKRKAAHARYMRFYRSITEGQLDCF